jgi:FkbM family methyltransferase
MNFSAVVSALDNWGFRRVIAPVATRLYAGHKFSVDSSGRWISEQDNATFVSRTLHTMSYEEVKRQVLDQWCWEYTPAPGDTIIDVGAGIGEEAVIFSHLVGEKGHVVCIEAHPDTFACLKETIRRSHLTNVTAVQCAIADFNGQLNISSANNHLASSVITSENDSVQVLAKTLDTLLSELKISNVNFLKMNIEGAERLAVKGMHSSARCMKSVVISCHDFLADYEAYEAIFTKNEVRSALEELGFSVSSRDNHPLPWIRDYLYGARAAEGPL